MRLRETIIAGVFAVMAAVFAALVPFLLPSALSDQEGVLFVRELQTEVSPELLVEQFRDLELQSQSRNITVLTIENIGSSDLLNFRLEIRTSVDVDGIQVGNAVSGDFFSADQNVIPLGDRSFQGVYRRFPANSRQDIFLLSDSDFSVVSVVSNRSGVDIVQADRSLFEQASNLRWQNYITGALWLAAILALIWMALRLFKLRATLQFRKVP